MGPTCPSLRRAHSRVRRCRHVDPTLQSRYYRSPSPKQPPLGVCRQLGQLGLNRPREEIKPRHNRLPLSPFPLNPCQPSYQRPLSPLERKKRPVAGESRLAVDRALDVVNKGSPGPGRRHSRPYCSRLATSTAEIRRHRCGSTVYRERVPLRR